MYVHIIYIYTSRIYLRVLSPHAWRYRTTPPHTQDSSSSKTPPTLCFLTCPRVSSSSNSTANTGTLLSRLRKRLLCKKALSLLSSLSLALFLRLLYSTQLASIIGTGKLSLLSIFTLLYTVCFLRFTQFDIFLILKYKRS